MGDPLAAELIGPRHPFADRCGLISSIWMAAEAAGPADRGTTTHAGGEWRRRNRKGRLFRPVVAKSSVRNLPLAQTFDRAALAQEDWTLPKRVEHLGQQVPKPPPPEPAPGPDIIPPDPPPAPSKPDIPTPDPSPLPLRNPGDNPLPPMTDPDIPDQGDPPNPPLRVAY